MSKKGRLAGKWNISKYVNTDGTTTNLNDSSTYYFKKGGELIISWNDSSFSGTWKFSDNKENLIINFDGDSSSEKIILLKNKEFATKDLDGVKTYYTPID